MARRFFVSQQDILNNKLTISGQEHIHIAKVLRLRPLERIVVSCDDGFEYECTISEIKKDCTICFVDKKCKIKEENSNITVFQALMKGEHMDFAVQKLTELNVDCLVPFLSKFVIAKESGSKKERFQRISFEACKQSGRKTPMKIEDVSNFDGCLQKLREFKQIVVAFEGGTTSAKEVLSKLDKNEKIALIVGSEGGFDKQEVDKFTKLGAKIVSLGTNILRGETAVIALASAVSYELDYWKI